MSIKRRRLISVVKDLSKTVCSGTHWDSIPECTVVMYATIKSRIKHFKVFENKIKEIDTWFKRWAFLLQRAAFYCNARSAILHARGACLTVYSEFWQIISILMHVDRTCIGM